MRISYLSFYPYCEASTVSSLSVTQSLFRNKSFAGQERFFLNGANFEFLCRIRVVMFVSQAAVCWWFYGEMRHSERLGDATGEWASVRLVRWAHSVLIWIRAPPARPSRQFSSQKYMRSCSALRCRGSVPQETKTDRIVYAVLFYRYFITVSKDRYSLTRSWKIHICCLQARLRSKHWMPGWNNHYSQASVGKL